MPYIEQDKVDAKTREKLETIIEKSYKTFWKRKRLFDILNCTRLCRQYKKGYYGS